MYCHAWQCIYMYNHVLTCIPVYYHVLLCIYMYNYVLPCISIIDLYCHVLQCTAMFTNDKDCPDKSCSNTTRTKRKRTNPQTCKRQMRGADFLGKQGFWYIWWSMDKAREHLPFCCTRGNWRFWRCLEL